MNLRPPRRLIAGLVLGLSALPLATPAPAAAAPSLDPRSLRGTIAFVCEQPDGDDELCLMDADGARVRRITDNPGPDRAPSWGADGTTLAFNSRRAPHADRPQIYAYDLRTGAVVRASDGPVEDQRPSVVPGGDAVVFQRGTFATGYELFRQPLPGGAPEQLTDTPGKINAAGSFAPDGTRLVLQSNRDAAGLFPFGTYVIDRISGSTTRIAPDVTASHDGPRWSPDGRRLTFSAGGDLYVTDLATGATTAVTTGDDGDSSPAWSPDGTKLAFQTTPPEPDDADDDHEDVTSIAVLDLASGERTLLGPGRTPVWSPVVRTPDYGTLPADATARSNRGLVHRLYVLALDRPVDPSGLAHWTGRLDAGWSADRVARGITGSREYGVRFGALDTEGFVRRIYVDGLRRDADPGGLAFWVRRIDQGGTTRPVVLVGFARSEELIRRIATAPR